MTVVGCIQFYIFLAHLEPRFVAPDFPVEFLNAATNIPFVPENRLASTPPAV